MHQLELFDSKVIFAVHHDRDKLKELRKTNKEAALEVLWQRWQRNCKRVNKPNGCCI
jgi:hypothetical protein